MNAELNGLLPHAITEESALNVIKKIKPNKGFIISTYYSQYSIAEEYKIDGHNTLIFVNVPYCLHIPDHLETPVSINSEFGPITLYTRKVWTNNASNSDHIDVIEEKNDIFFNAAEFTSAKMPQDSRLGWQTVFTGKNVDREKDNTGYFRYTQIKITFDTDFTAEDFETDESRTAILEKIKQLTLDVVNKLLDSYRYITREEYIERILTPEITDIQFLKPNVCFMLPNGLHWGIGDALMNHSWEQVEKIRSMLVSEDPSPIYDMLLLNAESAFNKKIYKLAVLESFQGFEIFLENFLIAKFQEKDLSSEDIDKKITEGNNWRTPDRLKGVMEEATGHRLTSNQQLWDKWYRGYDEVRNQVIHKNKDITAEDARESLSANLEVIEWMKQLT